MKNILLTTDFSDNANSAIDYAIKLFGTKCKYTLINSYVEPAGTSTTLVSISSVLHKESVEGLTQLKNEILRNYGNELDIETSSWHGGLFNVINNLSKKKNIDYVVVGSKGASGLEKFLVGSNTLDVMKRVKIPNR